MDSRLRLALQFVTAHCAEHLTVSLVARQLGLSCSRFEHLFRQETGTTFRRGLREIRVRRAAALLADPRLRVKEVAAHCGYDRTCDLTRAFKAVLGLSPSQRRDAVARQANK
ncbi:MAG TPA: AraC family transcriptional regulator [Terriglobia bacterium]|nr:AraC family transcriptional regulator [Terriglobia bacterium]